MTARGGRIRASVCARRRCCWAAPAAAQRRRSGVEFESYRLPGWSFTPSIAFGTIYDSNVALQLAPRRSRRRRRATRSSTSCPAASSSSSAGARTSPPTIAASCAATSTSTGLDGFDQRASLNARRGDVAAADAVRPRQLRRLADDRRSRGERRAVPPHRLAHQHARRRRRTTASRKFTTCRPATTAPGCRFDRPEIFLTGGWIHAVRNELTLPAVGARQRRRRIRLPHAPPSTSGSASSTSRMPAASSTSCSAPHTKANGAGGIRVAARPQSRRDAQRPVRAARARRTRSTRATVGAAFERHVRAVVRLRRREQQPGAARLRPDAAAAGPLLHAGIGGLAPVDAVRARRARSSTRSGCAPRSATPRRGGCGSKRSTPSPVRTRSSPAAKSTATASACSSSSHNP